MSGRGDTWETHIESTLSGSPDGICHHLSRRVVHFFSPRVLFLGPLLPLFSLFICQRDACDRSKHNHTLSPEEMRALPLSLSREMPSTTQSVLRLDHATFRRALGQMQGPLARGRVKRVELRRGR